MPEDIPEVPRRQRARRKKKAPSDQMQAAANHAEHRKVMQASTLLWRVRKELRRLEQCGDLQAAAKLREVVAPLLSEYEALLLVQRAPLEQP